MCRLLRITPFFAVPAGVVLHGNTIGDGDDMSGQPARVPPVYDGPLQERVEFPHLQLPRGDRRVPADTGTA